VTGPLRIGRAEALDTAIELTKRLGEEAGASVVDIGSTPAATTVQVSIPAEGLPGLRRLRRRLWTSFVDRSIARRSLALTETVGSLRRRSTLVSDADRHVERVRRYLSGNDTRPG